MKDSAGNRAVCFTDLSTSSVLGCVGHVQPRGVCNSAGWDLRVGQVFALQPDTVLLQFAFRWAFVPLRLTVMQGLDVPCSSAFRPRALRRYRYAKSTFLVCWYHG